MNTLSLGVVANLSMLPLLEGLGESFPSDDWVRATPRELAGLLAAGEIDVAAVSTFEGLRHSDRYVLVPGVGICSDGPVRSVALFSRVPLRQIRTVLLDRASLTSVHLAQVLASEFLEITPEYELAAEPLTADYDWRGGAHDALVVIGDTALLWENAFPHKLDLGEGWKRMTGLPFVFAAWWARKEADLEQSHVNAFVAARDRGVAAAESLAARVAREDSHWIGREASLQKYFTEAVRYTIGARELAAISLYRDKLLEHELLPAGTPDFRLWSPRVRG